MPKKNLNYNYQNLQQELLEITRHLPTSITMPEDMSLPKKFDKETVQTELRKCIKDASLLKEALEPMSDFKANLAKFFVNRFELDAKHFEEEIVSVIGDIEDHGE